MKKLSSRKEILKLIAPLLKTQRKLVVLLVAINVLVLLANIAQPLLMSVLMDKGLILLDMQWLVLSMGAILALFGVVFVLSWVEKKLSIYITNYVLLNVRNQIFEQYTQSRLEEYSAFDVNSLKMWIDEYTAELGEFYILYKLKYYFSVILVVLYLSLITWISPLMTLALSGVVPLVILCNIWLAKILAKENKAYMADYELSYSTIRESVVKWKEIKSLHVEKDIKARYEKQYSHTAKSLARVERVAGIRGAFNYFRDNYASNILVYLVATMFVINGTISIGVLLMFMQYFRGMFVSIGDIIDKHATIKTVRIHYDKVREVLDMDNIYTVVTGHNEFVFEDRILFDNTSFGYKGSDKLVLDNLTLEIKKGEFVGIVGQSGCGKSTMVKLLLGLYYPSSGDITIDDIDMNIIQRQSLYDNISAVTQESFMLNLSIIDNLKIAKPNARQDQIDNACSKAGILDFIQSLPNKYDSIVGEKGVKLSGGQRQRLSLAQALIKQPQVLILDEPTSALDSVAESHILETINSLRDQMTIIMIAHRKSTLKNVDRIVEIKKAS
jgi:ATP-binding cassette subfamily B protein/subfamily B ATP-binding cassette protein MsbA